MAEETEAQKQTVERVMHEFKHRELKGADGEPVRNPKQAIAIGLSEAGVSNRSTPEQNRRHEAHTHTRERAGETPTQRAQGGDAGEPSRSDLYAEARRRDIPNRSKMNKRQLERALAK